MTRQSPVLLDGSYVHLWGGSPGGTEGEFILPDLEKYTCTGKWTVQIGHWGPMHLVLFVVECMGQLVWSQSQVEGDQLENFVPQTC